MHYIDALLYILIEIEGAIFITQNKRSIGASGASKGRGQTKIVTKSLTLRLSNAENIDNGVKTLSSSAPFIGIGSAGPISGTPLQLLLDWYPMMGGGTKICATWYSTSSYDYNNLYLFYCDTLDFDYIVYNGDWQSGWIYEYGSIVRYANAYWRHIGSDDTDRPSQSSNWEILNDGDIPDVSYVSANMYNPVLMPTEFVNVESISSCGQGDYYETTVRNRYDGLYVVLSGNVSTKGTNRIDSHCVATVSGPLFVNILNIFPTIEYNSSSNSLNINSRINQYIVEFYRRNYNPTGYSNRILKEFFLTTMIDFEDKDFYGYDGYWRKLDKERIHRWRKNQTYTVGIEYNDTINQAKMFSAVKAAIDKINQVMSAHGIQFQMNATTSYQNTTGDITVTCGSHRDLFGYTASMDGWIDGQWKTSFDSGGYIVSAEVKLRNDAEWFGTFASVAMEELLQCMGAGYDQVEYIEDTVHSEFVYFNKPDYITEVDKGILDILYSDYIEVGMNSKEVALAVNPPNGAISAIGYNAVDLFFLKRSETYDFTVYVFDFDDRYIYSDPTTIRVTLSNSDRPDNWTWQTAIKSGETRTYTQYGLPAVSAAEWNRFTDRINEFRNYKGCSPYSFTHVYGIADVANGYRPTVFTAAIYNEAVNTINEISNNTTLLLFTPGMNVLESKVFTNLANALNAIE